MKILFSRVGWSTFYNGEQPRGGGAYNKTHKGNEAYNFKPVNGVCYGGFASGSEQINIERIEPNCIAHELTGVCVVFFARSKSGNPRGQVVIGWYNNAVVLEEMKSKPRIISTRKNETYWVRCDRDDAVLLPSRNRIIPVPKGKNTPGRTNIFYPYVNGIERSYSWMKRIKEFIRDYKGENLIANPEAEQVEILEGILDSSKTKGRSYQPDQFLRDLIAGYAMKKAKKFYKEQDYEVTDVSNKRPYDLECRKNNKILHVEVKGLQSEPDQIILTKNEVQHAQQFRMELFIVHSIKIRMRKNKPVPYGGMESIIKPWKIHTDLLTPTQYFYNIADQKRRRSKQLFE